MRKVLESKRAMRRRLAELPFAEKLAILEKLRERRRLIDSSALGRRKATIAREPVWRP